MSASVEEAEYALELQKALTGLTCGGSEFFVRHGDGFRADIPACLTYIQRQKDGFHEHLKRLIREQKAANAEIARLKGALEEIAALDKFGGYNTACHRARKALNPTKGETTDD